jgi:hypothetical protein
MFITKEKMLIETEMYHELPIKRRQIFQPGIKTMYTLIKMETFREKRIRDGKARIKVDGSRIIKIKPTEIDPTLTKINHQTEIRIIITDSEVIKDTTVDRGIDKEEEVEEEEDNNPIKLKRHQSPLFL